ncbi:MAG: hypothetical protein V1851_00840 [Patescibacteria group bacterium]
MDVILIVVMIIALIVAIFFVYNLWKFLEFTRKRFKDHEERITRIEEIRKKNDIEIFID